MMKFLLSVIHDAPGLATDSEMAAIDVFNDRLQTGEHWVFACGLADPSSAKVIDNRGSDTVVTDGPFVESNEFMIGFWVIDAPGHAMAQTLANEASKACNRKIEVRQIL